jgi:hypothetical protein
MVSNEQPASSVLSCPNFTFQRTLTNTNVVKIAVYCSVRIHSVQIQNTHLENTDFCEILFTYISWCLVYVE